MSKACHIHRDMAAFENLQGNYKSNENEDRQNPI